MARIRTIKPEFWDSPDTARASLRARLFYIAMWNWADDHGRGTANAKALIGFAFPNDDDVTVAEFPSLAAEVAECFGVVFYEADGRPFYAIPSWDKHQKNERRAQSRHPAPPPENKGVGNSAQSHGSTGASDGSSGTGTGEQGNRGTGEEVLAAPDGDGEVTPKPRPRDELFETVAECSGIDWHRLTSTSRKSINAAVRELRAVDATPEEVRRRVACYRGKYPRTSLTPMALAKHWPSLDPSVDGFNGREFSSTAPWDA